MAYRLAANSLRAVARPRVVVALPQQFSARPMSTSKPPPEQRASELIEKLPSRPGILSKTGTAVLGLGLTAAAISQELYVVSEETILLIGSLIVFTYIGKILREPYASWAQAQIDRIKGVLNSAREGHVSAVKERIESVGQMKDAVDVTKSLFALSKETAQLESEAFVKKQQVALAAEIKSMLDSWVRYEQQVKEREQADLAKSVIDKVLATLQDQKVQKDILANSVAEVEQLVKSKAI
ncbi:ATP4, subunit B of the stator stalk of mitochondrial F1F0 ATP synthase [Fistulina hepatica ATCC 64428]|uniref:ATP synthase subunit 4 n=1 Tax=Fistulina hepatica ATCC 64428 TaxID=1128425 RepID=A0A0D7A4W9_9AGAR|nr:ATP4, subunit B of the stator stalk of mitochondrial F1F0 ATP synthase [Fistulina hepatica ATCC 64428]